MKLSIVTTYFNRKQQFKKTLESIAKSVEKDIEVVVADDASDESERLEDLIDEYPFLKIIRINSEEKKWINPCIPFNRAIKNSSGDAIILQNPECYHNTDVIKYVLDNISDLNYLVVPVFALTNDQTIQLQSGKTGFDTNTSSCGVENGWYHHPIFRPCYYHFCSAISKKNMDVLQGFDERYAHGYGYDDDEFLRRVRALGLQIQTDMSQLVYHQHHKNFWSGGSSSDLIQKNRTLYFN